MFSCAWRSIRDSMASTNSCLVALFCLLGTASGYQHYQVRIPNGASVYDPADPAVLWRGVGHFNANGGGERNPFGKDFAANDHKWTVDLCMMDSDQDGQSNGDELGDPECKWSERMEPDSRANSHPGICEPINSVKCQAINSGVDFEGSEPFDCPATKTDDVKVTDFLVTKTEVPAVETSYYCQYFPLNISKDESEHIIAFEPLIDNREVAHHIIMYGCQDGQVGDVDPANIAGPVDCKGAMINCYHIVMIWGVGSNGLCFGDYGGRIGKGGFVGIWLQIHWNNPLETPGMYDASGIRMYHTPNLRSADAAFVLWGPNFFALEPGMKEVSASGTCTSERTWDFSGPKYIAVTAVHMHLLGREMKVVHSRHGEFSRVIVEENNYDYNDPKIEMLKEPIEFLPGDELQVTCTWNTEGQTEVTVAGESTQDEMCYVVAQMYPFDDTVPVFCGELTQTSGAARMGVQHVAAIVLSALIMVLG